MITVYVEHEYNYDTLLSYRWTGTLVFVPVMVWLQCMLQLRWDNWIAWLGWCVDVM